MNSTGIQVGTFEVRTSERLHRLIHLRDLVVALVGRNLKAQYKNSVLGVAWSLLNPLLQLLVFTFLFRKVISLDIPNYGTFAFAGLLCWSWFQLSLLQATGSVTSNRELVRRPGFPAAILPIITIATNLMNLLLALPLLVLFVVLGGGHITTHLLELPIVMTVQFVLMLSLAYLLATANVAFRDMEHIASFVLQLLFWLTPVFYLASRVPGKYRMLYDLNPMLHIIGGYRSVMLQGQSPDYAALGSVAVFSVALLVFSYKLFSRRCDRFVEEL
ncbi:MAG: ABC transporter permease [Limisphaerales bacterium]